MVRQAQQAAIDAVRAGVTGGEIDAVAAASSTTPGTARSSPTGSATASGWRSTRGRTSAASGDDVLPAGAVMTVEPGIYIPGLGGVRIEDMVEVRDDGCRVIGTSIRELIEL